MSLRDPLGVYDEDSVCSLDLDDHVEMVAELLPHGAAWPRRRDSYLMQYWTAFADMIKYLEDRICELSDQFFCETATETQDIWIQQYGIDAIVDEIDVDTACLKVGADATTSISDLICAKVTAGIGNTVQDFINSALAINWVVTMENPMDQPLPIAGCMEVGCFQLGPKATLLGGSNLGQSSLGYSHEGRAVDHPEPEYWLHESASNTSTCFIPGSELGISVPGANGCCMLAGYYEAPVVTEVSTALGLCGVTSSTFSASTFTPPLGVQSMPTCVTDGNPFAEYTGHAHTYRVVVDIPASLILQQDASVFVDHFAMAGCLMAGNECNPIRSINLELLYELFETMKPAHTVLYYDLTWSNI